MGELISRQAAIDEMEEYWRSLNLRRKRIPLAAEAVYMDLKGVVAKLPSAETRWIPCSERLPDLGISVLLNEGYSYAVGYLLKTTEGKYEWGVNGWYNDLEDWSAWLPLPTSWKGGDESCTT